MKQALLMVVAPMLERMSEMECRLQALTQVGRREWAGRRVGGRRGGALCSLAEVMGGALSLPDRARRAAKPMCSSRASLPC